MEPTATAFMRFKHAKLTHILLPYILAAIQQDYPKKKSPVASIKVLFSDNGQPYGAAIRLSGDTLGFVGFTDYRFVEKVLVLREEVKQYLIQACKQAERIVQPIVTEH